MIENINKISWDYSTDMLVIGTGFAGLSAAIEASDSNLDIMIIEKMKSFGGNSIISDGGIAAPNTDLQKKFGINDSKEKMYQDMIEAGLVLNNPKLLHTVVDNAKDAFLWLKNTLHVPFMDRVDIFGGHQVARCYTPEGITGLTIIKIMIDTLEKKKIPIHYSTSLHSFIIDDKGNVIGATILENYDYKNGTGIKKTIHVKKGIILATGGYGADVTFRQIQDPRLSEDIQTTNKPFATAEGLKSALSIGAASVQLSQIQLGAWASPDENGMGDGPLFADYILFQYGIIIDPKTAKRFVNELGDRKQTSDAILSIGHPCVGIADETAVKHSGWDISKAIKKGVVRIFDTLESMSEFYKINPSVLKDTISIYNQYVKNGKDSDYGKQIVEDAKPIEKFPYYAMRLWPKVHFTMGGIATNQNAQVLDFNGDIIPGLYAAGEVVGGVHGASRLGSCAVTECIVMGRIAGRKIALKN